jgi:hypothetical protein
MTRDEIIRMAREAGFSCLTPDESTDEAPHIYGDEGNIYPLIEHLIDLATYDERINMKIDGWRQCAKGQRTTQFCGQVQAAVEAEREACARMVIECALDLKGPEAADAGLASAAAIRARRAK